MVRHCQPPTRPSWRQCLTGYPRNPQDHTWRPIPHRVIPTTHCIACRPTFYRAMQSPGQLRHRSVDDELSPQKYQARRSAQHHLSNHLIPSDTTACLSPLVDPPYTEWSQGPPPSLLHRLPTPTDMADRPTPPPLPFPTLSLPLSLSIPFPALGMILPPVIDCCLLH